MSYTKFLLLTSLLLVGNAIAGSAMAQKIQEETVNAFSLWSASGRMIQTRPQGFTFVGMVSGRLFIEEDSGPSDSGHIICPVMIDLNSDSGDQAASGKCTIVTPEGARAFGEIACTGTYASGCDGKLTLVGGTGHLSGVTGSGRMNVRNVFTDAALQAGNIVEHASAGVAVWRDFHIRRPTQ